MNVPSRIHIRRISCQTTVPSVRPEPGCPSSSVQKAVGVIFCNLLCNRFVFLLPVSISSMFFEGGRSSVIYIRKNIFFQYYYFHVYL